MGPIWKVFCLIKMGMDVPASAVASILREQEVCDKDWLRRSRAEILDKRLGLFTKSMQCHTSSTVTLSNLNRNLQKRAIKAKHEQEFMETLCGVGCTTGEYAENGKGEDFPESSASTDQPVELDHVVEHQESEEDEDGDSGCVVDNFRPLLVLFDCETTGLSIYSNHITDVVAKVLSPVSVPLPTFSSLVRTGRNISATGK